MNNILETGKFFLIISGELLLLFTGVTFLVGLLQEFIPPETIQSVLTRQKKFVGNIIGAALGAVTPFCSCSTIPILVGLLYGGAPFGAAMSFLIASPLLNPVILGLSLSLLGLKGYCCIRSHHLYSSGNCTPGFLLLRRYRGNY